MKMGKKICCGSTSRGRSTTQLPDSVVAAVPPESQGSGGNDGECPQDSTGAAGI